jgi:hypothetical protein
MNTAELRWLADRWQWRLYLVPPLVTPDGDASIAYRRINLTLRAGPQPPEFDPFLIRAISPSEPASRTILEMQQRGRPWEGFSLSSLGRLSIDGVYVYPPWAAAAQAT